MNLGGGRGGELLNWKPKWGHGSLQVGSACKIANLYSWPNKYFYVIPGLEFVGNVHCQMKVPADNA